MISGVYKITCLKNNKVYVGQSLDINRRLNQHYNSLNSLVHRHHSEDLQEDWDKYGEGCFIADIIEECPPQKLEEREKYWIDFYKSDEEGYNVRGGYNQPIKDEIDNAIKILTNLKEKL